MFKKVLLMTIFIFTSVLFAQDKEAKSFAFVGVDACAPCHKTEKQGKQLEIWKNSQHSKAYQTLQTEKADAIAKEKGSDKAAVETEACLKCHAVGYNVASELVEKKFKVEDGVQCETCHGAGSEYKSLKVMKNKEEAIKNGLLIHEDITKFCVTCHNSESPTYKEFDFETYWAKIKHNIPE